MRTPAETSSIRLSNPNATNVMLCATAPEATANRGLDRHPAESPPLQPKRPSNEAWALAISGYQLIVNFPSRIS